MRKCVFRFSIAEIVDPIDLPAVQSGVGSRSATERYPELRRLYLERVRYHVYYEVRESKVVALAFWHGSRGREPES